MQWMLEAKFTGLATRNPSQQAQLPLSEHLDYFSYSSARFSLNITEEALIQRGGVKSKTDIHARKSLYHQIKPGKKEEKGKRKQKE